MGRETSVSAAGNLQGIEEAEDIAHYLLWGPGIGAYPVICHLLVIRAPHLHEVAVVLEWIVGRKHRPIAITGGAPCAFFRGNIQKNYGVPLQEVTSGLRQHCPAAEADYSTGAQCRSNVLGFERAKVWFTAAAFPTP